MPVTEAAANVVFDALSQSKSGLIPPAVCDERRAGWLRSDGTFDASAFSDGLTKAQAIVGASSIILYIMILSAAAALIAKAAHIGGF